MLPTPLYSHVCQGAFTEVYDPAEDTFLLIDALEKEAEELKSGVEICLEIGCGSGVVTAFVASLIGPKAWYLCTDINPIAALCTMETARVNSVHVDVIVTDLIEYLQMVRDVFFLKGFVFNGCTLQLEYGHKVEGLLPRLQGQVDLILFNPPYVVTPSEEVGSNGIEAAWAGGKNGREVIDRFLPVVPKLLSMKGLLYLLVLKENDPDDILAKMNIYGLRGSKVLSRQAGREHLMVLKFWRPTD